MPLVAIKWDWAQAGNGRAQLPASVVYKVSCEHFSQPLLEVRPDAALQTDLLPDRPAPESAWCERGLRQRCQKSGAAALVLLFGESCCGALPPVLCSVHNACGGTGRGQRGGGGAGFVKSHEYPGATGRAVVAP